MYIYTPRQIEPKPKLLSNPKHSLRANLHASPSLALPMRATPAARHTHASPNVCELLQQVHTATRVAGKQRLCKRGDTKAGF